jgi:hypothetical protein
MVPVLFVGSICIVGCVIYCFSLWFDFVFSVVILVARETLICIPLPQPQVPLNIHFTFVFHDLHIGVIVAFLNRCFRSFHNKYVLTIVQLLSVYSSASFKIPSGSSLRPLVLALGINERIQH